MADNITEDKPNQFEVLKELFKNTVKSNNIMIEESDNKKQSLDVFLADIIQNDKSSTKIKIEVNDKGTIPNINTITSRTRETMKNDTDRKLREIFTNKTPDTKTKEYVANIDINQK